MVGAALVVVAVAEVEEVADAVSNARLSQNGGRDAFFSVLRSLLDCGPGRRSGLEPDGQRNENGAAARSKALQFAGICNAGFDCGGEKQG